MNSQHFGFFNCIGNNIQCSVQLTYLISSTSAGPTKDDMKGIGTYMNKDNLRRSISLFSTRCLSKHTWITDQDRYIGEPIK